MMGSSGFYPVSTDLKTVELTVRLCSAGELWRGNGVHSGQYDGKTNAGSSVYTGQYARPDFVDVIPSGTKFDKK
jgi:hypothetical protein